MVRSGWGFSIPSNIAKRVVTQLNEHGHASWGWLGVAIQNVTPPITESLCLDPDHPTGALVASVTTDSPAVQALVGANERALKRMADQPDLAIKYIAAFLNRMTHQEVQRYYERYVQPYYTSDGQVNLDVARHAVDAVAAELGVTSVAADAIYAPSL